MTFDHGLELKRFGFLLLILTPPFALFLLFIVWMRGDGMADPFMDIEYPKADAAESSLNFKTYNRECKHGLVKCKAGDLTYCSKNVDCKLPTFNVRGTRMKEPLSWFDRFA
jgi:hypothetical protein